MTERTLTRRRLLVAGGSVLLAGCGGQASDDNRFAQRGQNGGAGTATRRSQPDADTETPTAPPTETEAETPTETPTDTDTETDTDTPTDTDTETEPGTETPTGAAALEAGEEELVGAVARFHDPVRGDSIVDVTSSATQFSAPAVERRLQTARGHLDRAAESIEVDYSDVVELRAFATVLERLTAAQSAVRGVYDEVQSALEALSNENFAGANGPITFLDGNVSDARDVVETLESETAPEDVTAIEAVTTTEYAEKIEQFHAELDGFARLDTHLQSISDGLFEFREGVRDYAFGRWEAAAQEFYQSNREFQTVSDALFERGTTGGVTAVVSDIRDVSNTMISGTDELVESCEAGMNRNSARRRRSLETAKARLSNPEFVGELPSVQRLRVRTSRPDDDEEEDDENGGIPGPPLGPFDN